MGSSGCFFFLIPISPQFRLDSWRRIGDLDLDWREGEMDQVLNKVGSYWFSKRASKEIDSIGDDISVNHSPSYYSDLFSFSTQNLFLFSC